MDRRVFFILTVFVAIFLSFYCWLNIGKKVLFCVKDVDKSGLVLSSYKKLFQFLGRLDKGEKRPLLLLIRFNDYVPNSQLLRVYRRFEPVAASPIVIGCNWKKNFAFWMLDFFVDQNFLNQTDIKSINLAIDSCFVNIFNEGVFIDQNKFEQIKKNSINLLESFDQGVIFEK